MIETFLVALAALLITLYVQARLAAREIRRNREQSELEEARVVLIRPRS